MATRTEQWEADVLRRRAPAGYEVYYFPSETAFLLEEPPVSAVPDPNRVLFVGTHHEFDRYRRSYGRRGTRLIGCHVPRDFWRMLLDTPEYCDRSDCSVAGTIITTGRLEVPNTLQDRTTTITVYEGRPLTEHLRTIAAPRNIVVTQYTPREQKRSRAA